MKSIVTIVLAAILLVGCDYQNPDGSYDTSKSVGMSTVVIDSCEYIDAYYGLAHKGNCKYCAERRKKELENLINLKEGKK